MLREIIQILNYFSLLQIIFHKVVCKAIGALGFKGIRIQSQFINFVEKSILYAKITLSQK